MAQMEEALQSILGDSQAMEQIMALAQSLSGGYGEQQEGSGTAVEEKNSCVESLVSLPAQDRDLALLGAVKPFLKPERQVKLERALELVRMLRMFRCALGEEGGSVPE